MDKNQLVNLLTRYTESSDQEDQDIISLKEQYPYSQFLHTLAARVSKDHHLSDEQNFLQMAAVHAADRSVLKEILSKQSSISTPSPAAQESLVHPKGQNIETVVQQTSHDVAEVPVPKLIIPDSSTAEQISTEKKIVIDSVHHAIADNDVADELMRDLKKLNSSKHNFEMLLVEYSELKSKPKKQKEPEPIKESSLETNVGATEATPTKTEKTGKSKKQRIIELARSKNTEHQIQGDGQQTTSKKKHETDELIEDIKSSKKEMKPEGDKQKEQMEIINHFIKLSPSISSARERVSAPNIDLNPIKSGEFGDNIVSETLVEILIKQGKKDKAIEVLKKLIWKYPQKKSYFASQIEDLKK